MTLDQYLTANEISTAAFAELIGAKFETVRRYRLHDRIPEPAFMARIVAVTDGNVTANDFYAAKSPQAAE
jgi:hypothetical protein